MTGARRIESLRHVGALLAVLALVATLAGAAAHPGAAGAYRGTNAKIAFVRDGDIYVINPNGSGETQITTGADFDFEPAWSPDGQRIAFSRNADIWLMKGDGTQQAPLTTGDVVDGDPTWSPDGRRLAFERSHEIFVISDDGTGLTNITNHPRQDTDPAWSPEGLRIAFTTNRDHVSSGAEDRGELYTMRPDGTGLQRITNNAGNDDAPGPGDGNASWRPDGLQLAFHSDRVSGSSGIFLISPTGTGEQQVPTAPLLSAFGPAWSPEGQDVVFSGFNGSDGDLYVVTSTGVRRLTTAPGFDIAPDWGPQPDRDGDALPDEWETNPVDFDGDGNVDLDLPAMGARPDHKDIYVEVDAMTGHALEQAAIDIVIASFAAAPVMNPDGTTGIRLHVDNGPTSPMDPVTGATWGSLSDADTLTHVDVLGTSTSTNYNWADFDSRKTLNFDAKRTRAFHYAIAAHQYGSATNDSSGLSRGIGAADFIVSLGTFCPPPAAECAGTVDQQAGTFMHELGHNLGLGHGGRDGLNRKTNYFSIMNYDFQFSGLVSTLGTTGSFDYSRFGAGSIATLDENALNEATGFGTVAAGLPFYTLRRCPDGTAVPARPADNLQVDWNCDGSFGGVFAVDITGEDGLTGLTPHQDWPDLVFSGGAIGSAGTPAPAPAETELMEPSVTEILEATEALVGEGGGGGDTDAPQTTASASPPANGAGWNASTVTVELEATDAGSGVAELVYSTGGPQTIVDDDSATVTITAQGVTTLTYFARDEAGNEEDPQTLAVRIDRTAPDATLRWDPATRDLAVAGEDGLSGVAGVALAVNPLGKHEELRHYVVSDRAGNERVVRAIVREHGKNRLVAELEGAELDVRWTLEKDGSLRDLRQRAKAGAHHVRADYDAKKNVTKITDRVGGEKPQRLERPGLVLLRLAARAGGPTIED